MQGSKLYVGNLSYSTTEEQLTELFGNYGEVKEVKVIEGRGFGFVDMSTSEEAEQAKEALDSTDFLGRTLRIDEARAPKPRERRGGGGYGGGGGGRRGGSRDSRRGGGGGRRGGGRYNDSGSGGGYYSDY